MCVCLLLKSFVHRTDVSGCYYRTDVSVVDLYVVRECQLTSCPAVESIFFTTPDTAIKTPYKFGALQCSGSQAVRFFGQHHDPDDTQDLSCTVFLSKYPGLENDNFYCRTKCRQSHSSRNSKKKTDKLSGVQKKELFHTRLTLNTFFQCWKRINFDTGQNTEQSGASSRSSNIL